MSVAKVIELGSASATILEDAVHSGLRKCTETVHVVAGERQRDPRADRPGRCRVVMAGRARINHEA